MAYWHCSPIGCIIRAWGQTLRVGRVAGAIGQRDEAFAGQHVIGGCGRRPRPGLDVTGCSGATATPKIDEDRQGNPYAAGELLVSYEPGASRRHIDGLVEKARARVEEELSASDVQLLSFPALKHERSRRASGKTNSGGQKKPFKKCLASSTSTTTTLGYRITRQTTPGFSPAGSGIWTA
jgi:hypothetical protein